MDDDNVLSLGNSVIFFVWLGIVTARKFEHIAEFRLGGSSPQVVIVLGLQAIIDGKRVQTKILDDVSPIKCPGEQLWSIHFGQR